MRGYLARRILNTIPTLFGVALIVFTLFHLVGGDPVYLMVGRHANAKLIEEVRHELGLDRSKPEQFVLYLKQVATFDYGRSFVTNQPIGRMIRERVGPSLTLAVPAFLLTTLLAVWVGLTVTYFRGRWIDKLGVVTCVLGMSVPMMAYILFGQYVFAYKLGWFPISGFETGWPECFAYVLLPLIIWIIVGLGYDVRFYRTALIEEIGQDYVRTARAKGLGEVRVFFKHVLKNGMVPILTNVVLEIPLLILGSFLLEDFFAIPGLGSMTIDALKNSDFPVLKAMTTLSAMLMIVGNLATDLLYMVFDPRVRLQ